MRVRHPYTLDPDAPSPDDVVHWGGRRDWSDVDDDGTFYVPDARVNDLNDWANGYGYSVEELLVDEHTGDSTPVTPDTTTDPETDEDSETCAGTTADGQPCSNPVGSDGYCHLASHGPSEEE